MAENIENNGCLQRDNAEHEGYAKALRSFNRIWKERDSAQPRLLEAILYKDNFNRAYKSIIYDKTGEKYHREKGFQVWCNGECIHKSLYPEEIKVAR